MKCRLEFPPDVKIHQVVKGQGTQVIAIEFEPLFFKPSANVPVIYLSSETDDKQPLARSIVMVAGKTGGFVKEDRNQPVRPTADSKATAETPSEPPTKPEQPEGLRRHQESVRAQREAQA